MAVLGVAVSVPSSVLTTAGGRPAGTAALHLLWCALVAAGALAARSAESVLLTGAAVAVPLLLLAPCFLAQACRVSRWRPDAAQWWQLLEALAVAGVLGAALREVLARHGGTPALLLALAGYAVAAGGYLVLRTRAWRFRPRAGGASRDR